jgi:anthranilate phosphoribosyltransferase
MAAAPSDGDAAKTSITPLLKRLWHESPATKPDADEIAAALSLIFTNSLSEVQTGALLTCLHFTDRDRQADILAKCSAAMRDFSTGIDVKGLEQLLKERGRKEGAYHGGLVSSVHGVLSILSYTQLASTNLPTRYSPMYSVTSSGQAATPTTRSTSAPPHQSWLHLSS